MLVPDARLREAIAERTPIRFDPASSNAHEPFIPLPPPANAKDALLCSLRLTPPRVSDGPLLLATLNDDSVWPAMRSIPYPLDREGVDLLLEKATMAGAQVLRQWEGGDWGAVDGFAFSAIRATVDGKEAWVGGVSLRRWPYDEVVDPVEKAAKVAAMTGYDNNDERILRTLGFYLHPSFQSKGIMSVVLSGFMTQYILPVVHARHLRATVYTWNLGSRRVFEKCGWTLRGSNWVNTGVGRGEKRAEEWWMEWHEGEQVKSVDALSPSVTGEA